ncbi:MAG TPA: hypothetical protein VFT99_26175, partial [Roseiflexaceae bacterium]|nr:hypothetical protein [Roseiflexaceae bacterium]
ALALASPFWPARLASMHDRLAVVRRAIWERDFELFGREVEAEALSMHAVALTSAHRDGEGWRSGVYYLLPDTLAILLAVQEWREQGLPVYFTLDAGPTVHLLCLAEHADVLAEQVQSLAEEHDCTWELIVNHPGGGAVIVGDPRVRPAGV